MNKKRVYYFLISLVIFSVIITAGVIKTNDWTSSDNVKVSIGTFQGDLQDAIDLEKFKGSPKLTQPISFTGYKGHDFGQIWVSVNGNEMTFQDAIKDTDLCGISSPTTFYSEGLDPGHYGNETEVTVDGQTKSLQDAINEGDLVNVDGGWSDWSDCSPPSLDQFPVATFGGEDSEENSGEGTKIRTCTNPEPICGGNECQRNGGSYTSPSNRDETQACYDYFLINNIHTAADCIGDGGTIHSYTTSTCQPGEFCTFGTTSTITINFCKFQETSCPLDDSFKPDWQQYESWSTTESNTCKDPEKRCRYDALKNKCTTSSHTFADSARETCNYKTFFYWPWQKLDALDFNDCYYLQTLKCRATVIEPIGCY